MPPILRSQTREAVSTKFTPPARAVIADDDAGHESGPAQFLTNDTSWVPPRINRPDEPPRFTINLALPPEQRYLEVCNTLKHEIKGLIHLFDEVMIDILRFIPSVCLRFVCGLLLRRVYNEEENRELQGISKATGLDMYLLVCFNTLLDLFMGCSSGGAVVQDGPARQGAKMVHFRTLDWGMPSLRRVIVQLDFQEERDGPIIASSITYAGFVGVLTGVRKDFSESLNFRPTRNEKGKFIPDCKYYWHLLMVLLGCRPSISSVLRGYLLSRRNRKGHLQQPATYSEIVQEVLGTHQPSGLSSTTACYLCFSDGSRTTVIEKDRVTAVSRSDSNFIVITNNDVDAQPVPVPVPSEEESETSPFVDALKELIDEAIDRKACAEQNWTNMRATKIKQLRAPGRTNMSKGVMNIDDVVELVQRYPTTNESTHFACVMDPKVGVVSWCRRWRRPIGAKWIREHS